MANKAEHAIATDLEGLGIRAGDRIMVHASCKALGPLDGGIAAVIRGILRAIGPEGTLLMPALSWSLRPPQVFDVRSTPSIVGAIAEHLRTRPGTLRSLHPTHSVCAVGPAAPTLLERHDLDTTPCGAHSPFRLLTETGGKVVMLGCGLKPNTTMHTLEELAGVPYSPGPAFTFTVRDRHGQTRVMPCATYGFSLHGFAQRYDRVIALDHRSFLRRGRVLRAPTFVLDAGELRRAVLEILRADPLFFVEPRPA